MPLVTRSASSGTVLVSATEPDDKTNGTIWIDISTNPPTVKVANGTSYQSIQNDLWVLL